MNKKKEKEMRKYLSTFDKNELIELYLQKHFDTTYTIADLEDRLYVETHHHKKVANALVNYKTKVSDLTKQLAVKNKIIQEARDFRDKYPYSYSKEYMLNYKKLEAEIEVLKDRLADFDKFMEEEGFDCIENLKRAILGYRTENRELKNRIKKDTQNNIALIVHMRDETENILDDALKNSSLNSYYYDELLDKLDDIITDLNEEKGDKNEEN